MSFFVNPRKSIRLKNRTKYFDPATCRTHVRFSSPESFQSKRIKIEGYESRLYWQYRYCEDHDGQTFFYTLTYNDENLPVYYDQPCFDYNDLRSFVIGGFQKQLLRKFGTKFKYFISAELGDGKGSRGYHNNPHYHVLFFLESANNSRFPYVKISAKDFRHLVRLYWQGFDQDDGFRDFRSARYGIATEGLYLGKVRNFRACMYCAKYVCKDATLKSFEYTLETKLRFEYTDKFRKSQSFHEAFFRDFIYKSYNHPLNAKRTKWLWSDFELIEQLLPGYTSPALFTDFYDVVSQLVIKHHLNEEFSKAYREFIDAKVHDSICEYRNRYCNKVRISNGVGEYALEFIDDYMYPSIQVPSKYGFKNRPISLFYYRKLYMDVVKDPKGQNLYVLNQLGSMYKDYRISSQIIDKAEQAVANFNIVFNDKEFFDKMVSSDVNTAVYQSFGEFQSMANSLQHELSLINICKRYAEYKLVYEDRFFQIDLSRHGEYGAFPDIDPRADYQRFCEPAYFHVSRSDLALDSFVQSCPEDWLPYYSHPYFLRYSGFFAVLDLCADYLFVQTDIENQRNAEEIAAIKRFHDKLELQSHYNHLLCLT